MHETPAPGRPDGDRLLRQALLYARGELAGAEAEAFEQALAHQQATRDALSRAVCLDGATAPLPDPAYRDAVQRRLRPAGWRGLLGPRLYHGHPALWTALGAAAVLLTFGLGALSRPAAGPAAAAPAPVAAADPPAEEAASPEPPRPSSDEMARVWAELHNSAHLTRAHEDEVRRKHRAEERSVKADERRARPLHHVPPRHD
jgi:hypothetical protein